MTFNPDMLNPPLPDGLPGISEIERLLGEMSRLIKQIELRHARKPSLPLRNLIDAYEPQTHGIMEAVGTALGDFIATEPSLDTLVQVRAMVAAHLRTWSSTSPVFYHVSHTPPTALNNFEIIDLLLDNRPGGADVASQILDHYYLNTVAVHAYRQRVAQLIAHIAELTGRRAAANLPVRILELHTGAARELLALAKERNFARVADVTCVASDTAALRRVSQRANGLLARRITTFRADPRTFVTAPPAAVQPYDIIFASVLFDQLKDQAVAKLIANCTHLMKPGGALLFGNFAPSMPAGERILIEWVMDWPIRCRSEMDLRRMFDALLVPLTDLQFLHDPFHASILTLATR